MKTDAATQDMLKAIGQVIAGQIKPLQKQNASLIVEAANLKNWILVLEEKVEGMQSAKALRVVKNADAA